MIRSPRSRYPFDAPATYKIRVQGIIAADWSGRLEGMDIRVEEPADAPAVTTLKGELLDQAALAGVLNTIYEMHFPVLSVKRLKDKSQ